MLNFDGLVLIGNISLGLKLWGLLLSVNVMNIMGMSRVVSLS